MPAKKNLHYILSGQEPVPCNDLLRFAEWMFRDEIEHRRVAETVLGEHDRNRKLVRISTVFLGLDHAGYFSDIKQLFETQVFGGERDGYIKRYATWQEAEVGHRQVVSMLKGGYPNSPNEAE